MSRILTMLAAIFVLSMIALLDRADAAQQNADGIRNLDQYEFSARRRQRVYVRRYYAPRPYYRPYYQPYGYQPYGYYRPAPFPFFPFFR